jgi:hypothetical protein
LGFTAEIQRSPDRRIGRRRGPNRLAKRIIVMAESGMQDRAKLQADALDFLANNPPNT